MRDLRFWFEFQCIEHELGVLLLDCQFESKLCGQCKRANPSLLRALAAAIVHRKHRLTPLTIIKLNQHPYTHREPFCFMSQSNKYAGRDSKPSAGRCSISRRRPTIKATQGWWHQSFLGYWETWIKYQRLDGGIFLVNWLFSTDKAP
ncbi:hypothetical protein L6452_22049 [Arctium lappa]|uniref:Uncharacterized protein n=1 Tax=Arctium lappa TaxID=4217 RepID=A0ACB9AY51_ARCLA|nr:hypothetical protein L6452_22049 [Arctium lappa]